jgi:hypothetical protein
MTRFGRLYGGYFLADMALGVVLVTLGLFLPQRYQECVTSPASALESFGFLLLSLGFVAHAWRARLPRILFALPAYALAGMVLVTAVSMTRQKRLLKDDPQPTGGRVHIVVSQAIQEPDYLRLTLAQSLLGLIGGVYVMRMALAEAGD